VADVSICILPQPADRGVPRPLPGRAVALWVPVPVIVALAQGGLHHVGWDDERAAGVEVLRACEPDEDHEVRLGIALEQ